MLYIQPDECVDCGACEPVCPVTAIFYEDDVPPRVEAVHADQRGVLRRQRQRRSGRRAARPRWAPSKPTTRRSPRSRLPNKPALAGRGAPAADPSPFAWPLTATIGSSPGPRLASGTSAGPAFARLGGELLHQCERCGVLRSRPRLDHAVGERLVPDSSALVGADDRQRPAAPAPARRTRCRRARR